jgi:hypothetical protein
MKKTFGTIALIGIGLYLLLSLFIDDFQINKYEDIQAVKEQQAIQKGWIPAILPSSAFEIAETHDKVKNEIYGMFKYKEADEAALLAKLTPSQEQNATMQWEGFLFHVDTEKNLVKYRNKPHP